MFLSKSRRKIAFPEGQRTFVVIVDLWVSSFHSKLKRSPRDLKTEEKKKKPEFFIPSNPTYETCVFKLRKHTHTVFQNTNLRNWILKEVILRAVQFVDSRCVKNGLLDTFPNFNLKKFAVTRFVDKVYFWQSKIERSVTF